MKFTVSQLKQIIKEEIEERLNENSEMEALAAQRVEKTEILKMLNNLIEEVQNLPEGKIDGRDAHDYQEILKSIKNKLEPNVKYFEYYEFY